jgi:hypothetical protein
MRQRCFPAPAEKSLAVFDRLSASGAVFRRAGVTTSWCDEAA